jgi:UDP-N-acetyl-D-mannosaminuronic acid dehydrogenase
MRELIENDRVVGGINAESTKQVAAFYRNFVIGAVLETDSRTAEMCKLTENASRDAQIAFANELSMICDRIGINVWELISLANKHPRVNILRPGPGVGGHCIAVDPWFIVHRAPEEAQLIRKAREVNTYKTLWVIEKIKNAILAHTQQHGIKPTVAIMGLAFKPNIDDLRESPALEIAHEMAHSGLANFLFVEPNVQQTKGLHIVNKEAASTADIVVFLVAHTDFKTLNTGSAKVLDFCGLQA